MKWPLFFIACTLAGLAVSSAQTSDVRRHLDLPGRTDCPSPWCEQTPAIHVLGAPDDPSLYLGDRISYERPSDWRDYAPLRDQVAELTAGATSDLDKVTALADWVKHSKVPEAHVYTTWPPSIIDIWGFPDGQCEEASFLLTAMLRLAGIPAMRFTTWNADHAAVRAFADGRWIVVDATPTAPDNSGQARLYGPDDPAVVAAFQERPIAALSNVAIPGTAATVDTFTLFSEEPVEERPKLAELGLGYAGVAFPVTNAFLYYDPDRKVFAGPGQNAERVVITYRIEAADASCVGDGRSDYSEPIAAASPSLMFRTITHGEPAGIGTFYPLGYIQTVLPTCGTWRIVYALSDEALDAPAGGLAYEDFTLGSPSDFALIDAETLQPAAGADMYCYRTLVDALERLPSFAQLGGVVPP
jgi:hypothetical protein